MLRAALALAALAAAVSTAAAAPPPRLALPYDVELDAAGRVYVADGGRHQVFRWDARSRRLVAVVGTGARGSSGDGGPAGKARIDEPTCLAFDRNGNLYVSDVHNGVVRRIDRRGVISTVARLRAAAGVTIDPSGRYLVVASIEQGVSRFELASGASETLAAIGDAGLVAPHGVAYDASGNLWIADPGGHVFRIAANTSRIEAVASIGAFRIVPQRDGSAFVVSGDPSGGRVERLGTDGGLTLVAGTGTLGRHVNGIPATGAAILPSDVAAVAGGALLLAQTAPVPAIRRIDRRGRITTVVR